MGVVEACGPGASKFPVGTRVVGMPFTTVHSGAGTWQQHLVAPEACLAAVPDAVSNADAAQAFVNPCTVMGMLRELAPPEGEWIVQVGVW